MKKIFTMLLVAGLFVTSAQAQITLTEEDMPRKFQRYVTAYVETDANNNFDATAGGSNATWDLSGISFTNANLDTTDFISPSATDFRDSFPNATMASSTESDSSFIMMQLDENGVSWLGAVILDGDSSMVMRFEKPLKYMDLPLNSDAKHSDYANFTLKQSFGTPPFVVDLDINNYHRRSYEVTGSGQLTMPDNQNYEVLRLRVVEFDSTVTITSNPLGSDTTTDVGYNYSYEFWAKGFGQPLARVDVDSAHNDSSQYIDLLDLDNTALGTEMAQTKSFDVYPNPASGYISITGVEAATHYSIVDITQREVVQAAHRGQNIDVSHLPRGLYVVELRSNTGAVLATQKLMIQ